jgi:hypothetical protein
MEVIEVIAAAVSMFSVIAAATSIYHRGSNRPETTGCVRVHLLQLECQRNLSRRNLIAARPLTSEALLPADFHAKAFLTLVSTSTSVRLLDE